jgi:hypothetical protein
MLAACSVRRANISALSPLRKALEKWSALSGKEAAKKKADTVCMIAGCHTGLDNFPLGQEWFERSLQPSKDLFGEQHAATARSLVGTGTWAIRQAEIAEEWHSDGCRTGRGVAPDPAINMGIQRFRLAISRIESTTCPGEYAVD